MARANLTIIGVALLLGGIAFAIFGYNMEPTTGEAIDNVFTGDFTDKRNLMMFAGLAASVVGGVFIASGAIADGRTRAA